MKKLIKFCKKNNCKVIFEDQLDCYYDHEEKTISIGSFLDPETQLFSLVHEIGHMIIESKENYDQKYIGKDLYKYNTSEHHVSILEEEIDAWNIGYKKCIKDLSLKIDRFKFEEYKIHCLSVYMNRAKNPKKFHKD